MMGVIRRVAVCVSKNKFETSQTSGDSSLISGIQTMHRFIVALAAEDGQREDVRVLTAA